MQFMRLVILLLLSSFAAAQCDKTLWVVEDDGIAGAVSTEDSPLKHARVQLLSSGRQYSAVTDAEGRFSIWPVPSGEYSFAVKGWGEHRLEVKSSRRGRINRPSLLFSKHKNCLLLVQIWVPSWENRDLRQLLWHRHRMVQARTRVMNQLSSGGAQ